MITLSLYGGCVTDRQTLRYVILESRYCVAEIIMKSYLFECDELYIQVSSSLPFMTRQTNQLTPSNPIFGILFSQISSLVFLWTSCPSGSKLGILLTIYSLSILRTCQYHLSLASLTLSPEPLTRDVPMMGSFLILSILVTTKRKLCFLSFPQYQPLTSLVVWPVLAETLLLHIIPDTFCPSHSNLPEHVSTHLLHTFYCFRWLTPEYSKSSTFFISSPLCPHSSTSVPLSHTRVLRLAVANLKSSPFPEHTSISLSSSLCICKLCRRLVPSQDKYKGVDHQE